MNEAIRRMMEKLLTNKMQTMVTFHGLNMVERATQELGENTPSATALSFKNTFFKTIRRKFRAPSFLDFVYSIISFFIALVYAGIVIAIML